MTETIIQESENGHIDKPLILLGLCLAGVIATTVLCGVWQGVAFGILWLGSLLFTAWVSRQDYADRKFIRGMLLTALIILVACCVVSYPSSGIVINATQSGETIIWTIADGTSPYQIWVNGVPLGDTEYPGTCFTTSVGGNYPHYVTVTDANNETMTASITPVLLTYPLWVWACIILWLIFCIISYRIYIASYGALIIGGILMLILLPDTGLAPLLRIVSAFFFVVGLSTIFIFKGE